MSEQVTPYKDKEQGKKEQVTQMFDAISGEYDSLNRVISLGIDQRWRKRLVKMVAAKRPKSILDIATGTGDLAIALSRTGAEEIIGLDIAPAMLQVGKEKIKRRSLDTIITMVEGDSEYLPFENDRFDAITVAFGVRNFEDLDRGLSEIYRVLKPGGIVSILETAVPSRTPFKQGYFIYTRYFLPLIGRIFSRDRRAYAYLSESAAAFPHGKAFNNILRKNGFISVVDKPQSLGVASIYVASK